MMLHGSYPCPFEDVNLDAMPRCAHAIASLVTPIRSAFKCVIARRPAQWSSRNTCDRAMAGPITRQVCCRRTRRIVKTVKQVTRIRGDGRKHPVQAELANLPLVRKNIAARAALAAGAVLRHERE